MASYVYKNWIPNSRIVLICVYIYRRGIEQRPTKPQGGITGMKFENSGVKLSLLALQDKKTRRAFYWQAYGEISVGRVNATSPLWCDISRKDAWFSAKFACYIARSIGKCLLNLCSKILTYIYRVTRN